MTNSIFENSLSRRSFLGTAAASATALALAACGGSSSTGSSTAAGGGKPKRGGMLRVAPSNLTEAPTVNPLAANNCVAIVCAMFAPLVDYDANMRLTNVLAEEFTPENNDPSIWTIRLKSGLEWHNGKPITADDVIFTIQTILDPKDPGAASVLLSQIDTKRGIKKLDDRTVRLHLTSPNSQLPRAFTADYSSLIPVGFDEKNPVGAGPFKQESFVPGQRWTGTRFANYWNAPEPYLDQLELLGFSSQTSAYNALLSGQVDGLDRLLPTQLSTARSRGFDVVISKTGSIEQIGMNCRKGQMFEDPRVRRAFRLMVNEKQLVNEVYGGYGDEGNNVGVYPQWDPSCSPSLPAPAYDPEQAKALLKAAGKENMVVPFRTANIVTGMTEAADILIQQAAAVGAKLTLDVVQDTSTYYTDAYFTAQLQSDWTETLTMFSGCSYYWLTSSGYNSAGYSNPKVDTLYKQALSHFGAAYNDPMQQISEILAEEGPWIVWGHRDILDVVSKKFTGLNPDAHGSGFGGWRFGQMSQV